MSIKRSGKMTGIEARAENGAKEGLILAGDLIAQRATRKAPVDTGRLKRSITRGNPFKTADGLAISVGSNVEYAPYQEFGTGDKSENPSMSKNPSWPGIPAHPYLRPAIEESRGEAITLIAKRVIVRMVRR